MEVDARGLRCPMPLALAKVRMAELAPGETLRLLATDPEASIDLAAWAGHEGHGFRELDGAGWKVYELVKLSDGIGS